MIKLKDQADSLRKIVRERKINSSKTKTIGVFSGKGGVGKSIFALNLALALNDLKKRVLLVDCDLGLFNLSVLMGLDNEANSNIIRVLSGEESWTKNIHRTVYGIDFLGGSESRENPSEVSLDFIGDIERSNKYQYIIVDTGPGVHPIILNAVNYTELNAIVTNPELTSITDSYALIKSLIAEESTGLFHLIINRCTSASEVEGTFYRLEQVLKRFLEVKLYSLGYIPEDKIVRESVKEQYPAFLLKPYTPSMVGIRSIARKIASSDYTTKHEV